MRISDWSADVCSSDLCWYNATKGAVNVLSKSMAVELAPEHIRVNAICPVMGVTGMFESVMGMPDTPQNRAKFKSTIPLGRFCNASDVASMGRASWRERVCQYV